MGEICGSRDMLLPRLGVCWPTSRVTLTNSNPRLRISGQIRYHLLNETREMPSLKWM